MVKKEVGLPPELQAAAVVARQSLATYIGMVHQTDDGRAAIPPRHLRETVIPAIEDDSLGNTLIVTPPGSAKTNTLIGYCAWQIGRDPSQHIGYVCNTGPEAEKRSMAVRDIVEYKPLYRAIFPNVVPNKNRGWKQDNWYVERPNLMDKNPTFLAVGVGGAIIGARLHKVVIDDICDEQNQLTSESRQKVHKFLAETVMTRLHPTKGRAIHITTRWHEEDAAAWCIDKGWTVIKIPATYEEAGVRKSYWPEYYPVEWLECPNDDHPQGQCCMKKQLGKDGYARAYMGEVMDMGNVRFKPENWRRGSVKEWDRGVIVADTAGWDEKNPRGDFAVLAAWVKKGPDFYCLEVQRGQWTFSEVAQRAKAMQINWSLPILVEDVPWARPLIDALRRPPWDCWGVNPWKVAGRSKFNRAESIVPIHEAGNCFLPKNEPWVTDFINEHMMFPNGSHDDQVDTTSMALMYLSKFAGRKPHTPPGKPFIREWDKVSA